MRINKTLGIDLVPVLLLLMSMAVAVSAAPWDGVPDDPTRAQAIWVDPKNTTCLQISETFIVDVLVNITSPTLPGKGTGMFGFEYKFRWNSTILGAESIQFHSPWPMPPAVLIKNETGVTPEGLDYHWLCIMALAGITPFTGVTSLCTYEFKVMGKGSCALDLYDDILVDDTATPIDHTTVDGYFDNTRWPWDLNGDGIVNIIDIVKVALAFDSIPGDPEWNPIADLNGDGIVNIIDVVKVAIHFEETCP